MNRLDWIIVILVWMLIPCVILLKFYLDLQSIKSQRKLNKEILTYFEKHKKEKIFR